jgi:uncharacterized RDD family membrane protein YckC
MATLVDLLLVGLVIGAFTGLLQFVLGVHGEFGGMFLLAYALFSAALIARNGRTPGQWLFELEVVDAATGGRPALRPAFVRAAVPVSAAFVTSFGDGILPWSDGLFAVSLIAPWLAVLWASLRSLGKQTLWDRLSNTLVRYRTRRTTAM